MTKLIYLGLVVFALVAFVVPSSVEAQCAYSNGYSSYAPSYGYSNYSPAIQYSNSSYVPSYGYNSSYYVPSNQSRTYNYGQSYNDLRSQRVRRLATAAIVAGVIVAASNSDGNRNRNSSRNRNSNRDRDRNRGNR